MTLKNKPEEPKKEKAEPVPAPNDDLVRFSNILLQFSLAMIVRFFFNYAANFSRKKTKSFRKSSTCLLRSLW